MNPPDDSPSCSEPSSSADPWPSHPELVPRETRNLYVLAVQQILFRIGWIFKTESVIMPAFLDTVAGAGWLRGCLSVINRFGQSIPPVFWAERLRATAYKKRMLALFVLLMSIPFGVLSVVWFTCGNARGSWLVVLFLGLYLVFFLVTGLYRVGFGTLQGKLIQPTRRGKLLWMSTLWGTLPAIAFVLWLMPGWLESDVPSFGLIFAFVAAGFFLSGLSVLLTFEPPDRDQAPPKAAASGLLDSFRILREDANLRRLVLVMMLANLSIILFPHYQALARVKLGLSGTHLITWLVAQNASNGIFSVLIGRLADSRGYRLTLQLMIVASTVAPILALCLVWIGGSLGAQCFWCVYIALGVVPLGLRVTSNYTLEICRPEQHTRYLSTVNVCVALPFLFAPVIGWLIDLVGYGYIFSGVIVLIFLSVLLSLSLEEPRHRLRPEEAVSLGIETEE